MPAHEAFDIPIVALEGLDGAGKTTLFETLESDQDLKNVGIYFTGEFKSDVGKLLYSMPAWKGDPVLKLYGFSADRAFLFHTISALPSRPSLIVWDRYIDSARAYREAEFRLGCSPYGGNEAHTINSIFPAPYQVFFLDIPAATAVGRKAGDRKLLSGVSSVYTELAAKGPYVILDAEQSPNCVADDAKSKLLELHRTITTTRP